MIVKLVKARIAKWSVAVLACLFIAPAFAAGGDYPLDTFPTAKLSDTPAMQRGAKLFVNYCMGCHSLRAMRYNRMRDIGLSEDLIKDNMLFTDSKVGETMTIAMRGKDAKEWFGALPPDLSLTARSRSSGAGSGADWIYTFLRSFYRDGNRPTGWNNALYPNVGMPHALWPLQGQRGAQVTNISVPEGADPTAHGAQDFIKVVTDYDANGLPASKTSELKNTFEHVGNKIQFGAPVGGQLGVLDYDEAAADLTAFLTYVSDPSAKTRSTMGMWVLLFLAVLFWAALGLNKAFWRDVK